MFPQLNVVDRLVLQHRHLLNVMLLNCILRQLFVQLEPVNVGRVLQIRFDDIAHRMNDEMIAFRLVVLLVL